MLKPEQVPDEVVEALLDASNVAKPWHHAVAAAINAWPGMWAAGDTGRNTIEQIVLPVPQENTNDQS